MGLDITAYSNLKKIDCVFDADGEPINPKTRKPLRREYIQVYLNPDFPGRADELEDRAIYSYKDATGLHAGSYGGYNHFREKLAELGGYALSSYNQYNKDWPSHAASAWEAKLGPFWEMINFSDCEGFIGAKVSQKLANDFADHQSKADNVDDERFREKYKEWRKAFELASKNGAVSFH